CRTVLIELSPVGDRVPAEPRVPSFHRPSISRYLLRSKPVHVLWAAAGPTPVGAPDLPRLPPRVVKAVADRPTTATAARAPAARKRVRCRLLSRAAASASGIQCGSC